MSRRLGADTDAVYFPSDFPAECNRLLALNCFHRGVIDAAYHQLGLKLPETVPDRVPITAYNDDLAQFKRDMRALADRLDGK